MTHGSGVTLASFGLLSELSEGERTIRSIDAIRLLHKWRVRLQLRLHDMGKMCDLQ